MREDGIPAANIDGVDLEELATADPATAAEIARIADLMRLGRETEEEFVALVRLLHAVGHARDAEHLWRRVVDSAEGRELYESLFSSSVPDEFRQAIQAFGDEFNLEFHRRIEVDFLVEIYDSAAADRTTPRYNVLHQPCVVRFSYARQDIVIAEVITLEAEQQETANAFDLTQVIFLAWKEGNWRLVDWRDA